MPEKYKRKANTSCSVCKKAIYRRPFQIQENKKGVFCSNACYGFSCRREKPCDVCKKPILAGLNRRTCSKSCSNKSRKGIRYGLERPYDKVKDQRTIKKKILDMRGAECERCKFNIVEVLQVHHKDRKRNNNKSSNLEILCPNCHSIEHYVKNK